MVEYTPEGKGRDARHLNLSEAQLAEARQFGLDFAAAVLA